MENPIKGIIAVTSNYGVGKTTFALECGYHPKDIIFINDDVKTLGFENEFKKYIDLVAVSEKKKVLELHNYCLGEIRNLPESKVIIWDTWTQFQSTFPVYVRANLNEFRNSNAVQAYGQYAFRHGVQGANMPGFFYPKNVFDRLDDRERRGPLGFINTGDHIKSAIH